MTAIGDDGTSPREATAEITGQSGHQTTRTRRSVFVVAAGRPVVGRSCVGVVSKTVMISLL
jgi:hypothetical protein